MSTVRREDPYSSFLFAVEIQDIIVGEFSEVSGLESETEVEERKEGGENFFVHKLPIGTKYGNIILKKGLGKSSELYDWYNSTRKGEITQKKIDILLLDSNFKEVKRWSFADAFPIKWSGPAMTASNSELAIQSVELVHKGFELIK